MRTVPSGDAGDALDRLLGEQWHILELFDSYARAQRGPAPRVYEAARLATLIYALLRVHGELEAMLLRGAEDEGAPSARAAARRQAVFDSLRRAQAMSAQDAAHVPQMAVLAQQVCAWFRADEQEVFAWARASRLDLNALDQEMARHQQQRLDSGRQLRPRSGAEPAATVRAACG